MAITANPISPLIENILSWSRNRRFSFCFGFNAGNKADLNSALGAARLLSSQGSSKTGVVSFVMGLSFFRSAARSAIPIRIVAGSRGESGFMVVGKAG